VLGDDDWSDPSQVRKVPTARAASDNPWDSNTGFDCGIDLDVCFATYRTSSQEKVGQGDAKRRSGSKRRMERCAHETGRNEFFWMPGSVLKRSGGRW